MRKIKTIIKSSSVALAAIMILGCSGMMAYAASGEFTGEKVQTINTDELSAAPQADTSASTVSGKWGTCDWKIVDNVLTISGGTAPGSVKDTSTNSTADSRKAPWASYNRKVRKVIIEDTVTFENNASLANLFKNFESLDEIDGLEKFDTSKVTNMADAFYGCNRLIKLDLSAFDLTKAGLTWSEKDSSGEGLLPTESKNLKQIIMPSDLGKDENIKIILNDMYTIATSWTDKTANVVYADKPDTLIAGHRYVVTGSGYDTDDGSDDVNNDTVKKNGLALSEDGSWYYYTNGEVDADYTGLADNEYGWWKITDGTVDFTANGLQFDTGTDAWWYFNGGAIDFAYTGLALNEYGWWKITAGTVDFGYNGLGFNEDGWWKVNNGVVDFTANGLQYDASTNVWWYFAGGLLDFKYIGLAENDSGWWKIADGTVDCGYNGRGVNEYGWWKVTDGKVDFSYTGLVSNEAGWWKVVNGAVDFTANGLQYDPPTNIWWYFNGGAIDFAYKGLAVNEDGWWYISNGTVDFTYNGMSENEYGWWAVTDGVVNLNFYGISYNIYGSWKLTGGYVDFLYTGEYNCNDVIYHVLNGHIEDDNFTGIIVDINLTPSVEPDVPYEPDEDIDEDIDEDDDEDDDEDITYKQLDVDCILQNPELPTGCEVTSLAIVLNYYGYDVDKCDLSDYYLDKGDIGETNPNDAFLGDPRDDDSYGCYAPVIVNCANYYLEGDREVVNLTDTSFEELFNYIKRGIPVIIWATRNMRNSYYSTTWDLADGEFTWKSNEHCIVLTGFDYDDGLVYVADPLVGNTEYDIDTISDRYAQMGYQAVVII